MRTLAAVGAGAGFVLGAGLGVGLGVLFFAVALVRAARPVHADGVICRAELTALHPELGAKLAGPALARFSGAFTTDGSGRADVLGLLLRLRRPEDADSPDLAVGDQDLVFGTFESFRTAPRDRAATEVSDYLANRYSSVARWWIPGHGPATLRVRSAEPSALAPPTHGETRLDRLDRALTAGQRLIMSAELEGAQIEVAEIRLLARLDATGHTLQGSMFLCGRGVRPVGFRNGLRATLYPMSQFGRRLRGS